MVIRQNNNGISPAKNQRALKGKQRGFSMLEIGVALIVIAGAAYAVFNAFENNSRRASIQDNTNAITQISADIKKKFGLNNQYAGVTTAVLVNSRTIPQEMRTGAGTANNTYGGAITAAVQTLTVANDGLRLTWPRVPTSECMDLVTGTQQVARRVRVAGTDVKPLDGALNQTTLSTQCESAAVVTVDYDIGR